MHPVLCFNRWPGGDYGKYIVITEVHGAAECSTLQISPDGAFG